MAGVVGLTGLTGNQPLQVTIANPGATADVIHGDRADPAHGQYEWDVEPFPLPWEIQPRWSGSPAPVVAPEMLGDNDPPVAGQEDDPDAYADPTATFSHGGPWPLAVSDYASTRIEQTAEQSTANEANRSLDSGVPESFTEWPPPTADKMEWERSPDFTSPGSDRLGDPGTLTGNNRTGWVRGQGWTGNDPLDRSPRPGAPAYTAVGGAGGNLNGYGFDSAHVSRFAPGSPAYIPVPDASMMGAQRPMLVQLDGRHTYPVAGGGPFDGQTPGMFVTAGGELTGLPSDYAASPDPPTGPAFSMIPAEPVWGFNGW
jgi:hypothetical protein